jgi:hypothetical protein
MMPIDHQWRSTLPDGPVFSCLSTKSAVVSFYCISKLFVFLARRQRLASSVHSRHLRKGMRCVRHLRSTVPTPTLPAGSVVLYSVHTYSTILTSIRTYLQGRDAQRLLLLLLPLPLVC